MRKIRPNDLFEVTQLRSINKNSLDDNTKVLCFSKGGFFFGAETACQWWWCWYRHLLIVRQNFIVYRALSYRTGSSQQPCDKSVTLCRWENWDSEMTHHSFRVTQLVGKHSPDSRPRWVLLPWFQAVSTQDCLQVEWVRVPTWNEQQRIKRKKPLPGWPYVDGTRCNFYLQFDSEASSM